MKKELLDFIQALTKKDKKTLSQKTLKTVEEVGELARVVLPYEDAAGTKHRFSDKDKILEEVADSMLCLLSIAYDIGADDEALENVIWKKAEYWAELQNRDVANPFPLPFEIHVSVSNKSKYSDFVEACKTIGVKAISLDLKDTTEKTVLDEIMTTSKMVGNNKQAYDEVERISTELTAAGFEVVRKKIETVSWHPAAPKILGNKKMPKGCYFETHIEILVNMVNAGCLAGALTHWKASLSYNKNKAPEDGSKKALITIRDYKSFETMDEVSKNLHEYLTISGFKPSKPLIEYALYDTNPNHDKEWIKDA